MDRETGPRVKLERSGRFYWKVKVQCYEPWLGYTTVKCYYVFTHRWAQWKGRRARKWMTRHLEYKREFEFID